MLHKHFDWERSFPDFQNSLTPDNLLTVVLIRRLVHIPLATSVNGRGFICMNRYRYSVNNTTKY